MFISRWTKAYAPVFQEFAKREFKEFEPHYVILVPRKAARVYTSMNIIPKRYKDNVISGDAIEALLNQPNLPDKKIVIGDDVVQHGIQMRRFRRRLMERGVPRDNVKTICLARLRAAFKKGELADPFVVPCLDLNDREFGKMTADVSDYLLSLGRPLEIDHLVAEFSFSKELWRDHEDLDAFLASYGRVYVMPSPAEKEGIITITLDEPAFFDTRLFIPHLLRPGVTKIRFYLKQREQKVLCVPMAYPEIVIGPDFTSRLSGDMREPLERMMSIMDGIGFPTGDPKARATVIYQSLCMLLATRLLSLFIRAAGKYVISRTLRIPLDDLILNLGPEAGRRLNELLDEQVREAVPPLSGELPPPYRASSSPSLSTNVERCANEIWHLLFKLDDKHKRSDTSRGYSLEQLHEMLPNYGRGTLDRSVDTLVGRSIIKPFNQVCPLGDGQYRCKRVYQIGENGRRPKIGGKAVAFDSRRREIQRMVRLLPVILDRLEKDLVSPGVYSKYYYKVLVNLIHDWNADRFGELFLRFKPYLYGPIPFIPLEHAPYGDETSIPSFLEKYKVGHVDKVSGLFMADRVNEATLPRYFEPEEIDVALGLVEIYKAFYKSGGTKLLTGLSACRNRYLAYLHAHSNITLWSKAFETMLHSLDILVDANHDPGFALDEDVNRLLTCDEQTGNKIAMYVDLPQTAERIERILDGHPRKALGTRILESLDATPYISAKGPNPLAKLKQAHEIVSAFTDLAVFSLHKSGMTSVRPRPIPDRDDAVAYVKRLIDSVSSTGATPEDSMKLWQEIPNLSYKSASEVQKLVKSFEPMQAMISRLDSPTLETKRHPEKDQMRSEVIYQVSDIKKVSKSKELAIALIDIQGFVPISVQASDLLQEDDDLVRMKMRERVQGIIDDLRTVFHPEEVQPVGGDGWILTFPNAHDAIRMVAHVHKRLHDIRTVLPINTGITWGEPGLTGGGALDRNSIIIYYFLSKSGKVHAGDIWLSESLQDQISDRGIREACGPVRGVKIESFGKRNFVALNWKKLSL